MSDSKGLGAADLQQEIYRLRAKLDFAEGCRQEWLDRICFGLRYYVDAESYPTRGELGQIAWDAHCSVPSWEDVDPRIQDDYCAIAEAVIERVAKLIRQLGAQ